MFLWHYAGDFMTKNTAVSCILMSCTVAGLLMLSSEARAQTPFDETMQQLSSRNVQGYLQPFVNSTSADMNAGFYHSASISDFGLNFQFQIIAMAVLIGDNEKFYDATPPQSQGYSQQPVRTATVFGDKGAFIQGPAPGLYYQFQNGQFKTAVIPGGVPQLTIGNLLGTQAILRYIQLPQIGNVPRTTLAGGGIRHSLSRYFSVLPVDVAAGVFYQRFTFGDYITASAAMIGVQASKSFSILTLYGGLQYEETTMSLNYTFKGEPPTKVSLDLSSINHACLTLGLCLNLALIDINGDISIGNVTAISAGFGFGL